MRTILLLNNLFLIFAIIGNTDTTKSASAAKAMSQTGHADSALPGLTVTLRTATNATILFKSENGKEVTAPASQGRKIPHLVLNRNGVLTPSFERTLLLSLENLVVPKSGLYAHLLIETQHSDPDLGRKNTKRVQLWNETKFIPYSGEAQQLVSVGFNIVFQGFLKQQQKSIRTPTDYYSYQLTLFDSEENILREINAEYAFLMENQWRVPLPKVLEASPGAAPNELLIYYYDMSPFQADLRDPDTQIPRQGVARYIQTELIPAMMDAFETQTNLWGLPWYKEWSNYRTDEDPKTLSVALGEYSTWFHGPAPSMGHALISIRVDGGFREYSNITDGILSVFHHELFHNQQRNISFHFGDKGNIAGKDEAWKLFTEGTAVLASFVGQPTVQFEPTTRMRAYLKRANAFIGSDGQFIGDLNKSYQEVPYHFAIYWRFLYESCGGIKDGLEDPATGMTVIRHMLEVLYKGEVVNINSSTDVTAALPRILDAALQATPTCAFHSYEESLIHFARAIYLLRLEDGRCSTSDHSNDCGFYDPQKLYQTPPAEDYMIQTGSTTQINGSISTSYGIDLIELELDPSAEGKALKLIFKNISDPESEFNVQLWTVKTLQREGEPESYSAQMGESESMRTENGYLTIEIDNLSIAEFNKLGLIITRMDSSENTEASGRYLIQSFIK
jgi:hypothetical protein